MKVKTVIISVVVSASLVAGVGYGAYYAIRGKATPVEVVPVANVNQYYGWGDEDGNTVYGTITSQVAQTVSLNQDYQVADIYVQEGQKVKEGEALFSYDMTLPELELEMAKLNLQTQELTMVRLEKDLEKLADLTAYPVYVGFPEGSMTIESREDMIAQGAEKIFTQELIDSVGAADETALIPSMAGFVLSDGGKTNIIFAVSDGDLAIVGINY